MTEVESARGIEGRVVVVTGAARGLGREITLALASRGAKVVAADIEKPAETGAQLKQMGALYLALETDVGEEDRVAEMTAKTVAEFGRVDVLVNNAGISQLDYIATQDSDLEEWERVIRVNLTGAYLTAKHAGRHMIDQGGGNIINVASTAGLSGVPRAPAYCASKAGLIMLTKSLALEWAEYNVRVNAIAPHYLETELTTGLRSSTKVYNGLARQIPLKRFAKASEMIGAVLLLAGDDSSFMTGSVIVVDGGYLAK